MIIAFNIFLVIATFLFMEGVAYFTHKYVMHGFLWSWHKSHHTVHDHALEKNDLFAVVFSVPAMITIFVGSTYAPLSWLLYIGIGITAYGVFYVLFHDILVHQRIKFPFRAKSPYMKRMIHAHYVHHVSHDKDDAESFGFLIAPKRYAVKDITPKSRAASQRVTS